MVVAAPPGSSSAGWTWLPPLSSNGAGGGGVLLIAWGQLDNCFQKFLDFCHMRLSLVRIIFAYICVHLGL